MNIYLIRHGKAEPASPDKKDFKRQLTADGRDIVLASAVEWKEFIKGFDKIIYSPYVRAKQTAEIIGSVFNCEGQLLPDESLAPGCTTESIIDLANAIEGDDIAFVGHQPDMGYHISKFISSNEVKLKFSPASIARISFESKAVEGKGMLMFLLPPVIK